MNFSQGMLLLVAFALATVVNAQINLGGKVVIGTAIKGGEMNSTEQVLYEYTGAGVINYLWFTGAASESAICSIYIDGETEPSLNFNFYEAAGIGFKDETAPWSSSWNGKNAENQMYITFRIPFSKSIKISAQLPAPPPQPPVTPDPQNYYLGKMGDTCTDTCKNLGLICNTTMQMGQDGGKSLIDYLRIPCDINPKPWWAEDQPSYCNSTTDPNSHKCVGTTGVPTEIDCDGKYFDTSRICHCNKATGAEIKTAPVRRRKQPKVSAGGKSFWFIVRGLSSTDGTPIPVRYNEFELPPNARLKLYKNTEVTLQPLNYTTLYESNGVGGAIWMVYIQATSHDENFLEACIRVFPDGASQPLFMSSGTEDFFNSAYYYNVGDFHDEISGLSHHAQDGPGGDWQLSMYRLFDKDPITFTKSMKMLWRNYEDLSCPREWNAPSGKSMNNAKDTLKAPLITSMTYDSYVWVYEW